MSYDESCFHLHVGEITNALVQHFGRPTLGNKRNPFNELLYIILSSRTPPDVYQETYRSLRREFKTANSIAEARTEYVAATIEQGGLHNKKARTITAIASELKETYGRVTLAPLKDMETEEAERFLTSLPGVSTKTARCVLMYALGRPVFPVDVHCRRVAHRLGWTPSDIYLTKRQADELQEGIPEPLRRDLHVGMVLLGRYYCLPKNLRCRECPLLKFCSTGAAS